MVWGHSIMLRPWVQSLVAPNKQTKKPTKPNQNKTKKILIGYPRAYVWIPYLVQLTYSLFFRPISDFFSYCHFRKFWNRWYKLYKFQTNFRWTFLISTKYILGIWDHSISRKSNINLKGTDTSKIVFQFKGMIYQSIYDKDWKFLNFCMKLIWYMFPRKIYETRI